MNKPSTYILLATQKESNLFLNGYGKLDSVKAGETIFLGNNSSFQYLHILSSDEITEEPATANDRYPVLWKGNIWIFDHITNKETGRCSLMSQDRGGVNANALLSELKRVIASTDPLLIKVDKVPQILPSDLEYIISLYNGKGKEINMEELAEQEYIQRTCSSRLLFDRGTPKQIWMDGYITNKTLSDNAENKYTESDVIQFLREYSRDCDAQLVGSKRLTIDVSGWTRKNIPALTKSQPKTDAVLVEHEWISDFVGEAPDKDDYIAPKTQDGYIVISRG